MKAHEVCIIDYAMEEAIRQYYTPEYITKEGPGMKPQSSVFRYCLFWVEFIHRNHRRFDWDRIPFSVKTKMYQLILDLKKASPEFFESALFEHLTIDALEPFGKRVSERIKAQARSAL